MAHPCINCGSECYCSGDIDDAMVSKTPKFCEGCGCEEMFEDDDYDEPEFIRCSDCDGHDACVDFGCAIEAGIPIKTDIII